MFRIGDCPSIERHHIHGMTRKADRFRAPMRRLDPAKLRPGDVILTSDNSPVSQAIRKASRSDISHAMIFVESHSIIEADRSGVHARNIQRLHFPADRALYVLRPKPPLTPAEVEAVVGSARNKIGAQYTIAQAALSISPIRAKATRHQFCSRLVGQAYADAGRVLGRNPNYLSPGDLLKCSGFERVEGATLDVDDEAAWAKQNDLTTVMVEATNAVLRDVRKLNPGVQTFEDVVKLLVATPHHDAAVLAAYRSSGYLEVWRLHIEATPWHYNLEIMNDVARQAAAEMEAYCVETVTNRDGHNDRYRRNLSGYTQLYARHRLQTFGELVQLYQRLVELDEQRLETALAWLRANAPQHVPSYKPHTEAWFAALELRNPRQAAMTRQAIATAGRPDVCSICGDDPAADARLVEVGVPEQASLTLRLCEDCRAIRIAAGETYVLELEDSPDPP